jgi:hypothetical protein
MQRDFSSNRGEHEKDAITSEQEFKFNRHGK